MRYGVPYTGSKNAIAKWVIDQLPAGERLVDLFAGGCAITHAAMLSGKWERFLANDIDDAPQMFYDAIHGKYADRTEWVSHDDFFERKDADPFVRLCWSFGNDGHSYMYSRELEPYKRAVHMELTAPTLNERYIAHREAVRLLIELVRGNRTSDKSLEQLQSLGRLERLQSLESLKSLKSLESLECLQSLERLQSLESLKRLQSLESLKRLESLEVTRMDYRDVTLMPGDIVYCDIPYRGTGAKYCKGFDYEAFYDWAEAQTVPVYISEYDMPEERFEPIAKTVRRGHLCATKNNNYKTERIYRARNAGQKWSGTAAAP